MDAFTDMGPIETIFFVLIVYSPLYLPFVFIIAGSIIVALLLMKKKVAARRLVIIFGIGVGLLFLLGIALGTVL